MTNDRQLLVEAARLLALALAPKKRPSQDSEYARLVRRYSDEVSFEDAVRDIATGLGLRVLDVSDFGVVLGSDADSPFSLTVDEYRKGLASEERILHGMAQLGIAAFLYPRAEDLESDAEVAVASVRDVDVFLREACQSIVERSPLGPDAPSEKPELERAAAVWLRWPSVKQTKDGIVTRQTTYGIITAAFRVLDDHGLVMRVSDDGEGTYRALRRYRVHVRELASHEALRVLRTSGGVHA